MKGLPGLVLDNISPARYWLINLVVFARYWISFLTSHHIPSIVLVWTLVSEGWINLCYDSRFCVHTHFLPNLHTLSSNQLIPPPTSNIGDNKTLRVTLSISFTCNSLTFFGRLFLPSPTVKLLQRMSLIVLLLSKFTLTYLSYLSTTSF